MNIKLNHLLIPLLVVSLAGNVLFYSKIGELEEKISQYKKEAVPVSQKENIKKEEVQKREDEDAVISVSPKEIWETYTSSELGFSIKYPQMVFGTYRCSPKRPFYVPLKVLEDNENEIVYITKEYFYEAKYDGELNEYTGPCEKIINSLEYLKSQRETTVVVNDKISLNYNPFLTKVFIIKNINDDIELDKFIKDNYGSGCFAGEKELWKQEGVYEIKIKGEDWGPGTDLGTTTCPLNYTYKILYALEKNKVMSVNLGQDCGFGTDYDSEDYECYDGEMIDSFRFE